MKKESVEFSLADFVALFCSIAIGVAFLVMPWVKVFGSGTTGLDLASKAQSIIQNDISTLWLIPFAAVIGGVAGLLGLVDPSTRRLTGRGAGFAGVVGLLYYLIYFLDTNQSPLNASGLLGIGFWVAMFGCIGLVVQIFIPRAHFTTTPAYGGIADSRTAQVPPIRPRPTISPKVVSPPVSYPVTVSTRVDKLGPGYRVRSGIRAGVVVILTVIMLLPVLWMVLTALKSPADIAASPPKVVFEPSVESFIFLFTERTQLQGAERQTYRERDDLNWAERAVANRGQQITRVSDFPKQLRNSFIIAGSSTIFSVIFGVMAAYAFSRFRVAGEDDWLFFILSTRMLPPVVVSIPIFLMYREIGLDNTFYGLILLYTAFNLSFSVWLMKGFMDEIPKEYEEAALVDGYTRMQAFRKIVLPQAVTGIAATTVFCFIFAWNEYAFAAILTSDATKTVPPSIPNMQGVGRIEWETIAAASLLFLLPVVIVTFALRKHLLRGVTFGAIRKG